MVVGGWGGGGGGGGRGGKRAPRLDFFRNSFDIQLHSITAKS